MHPVEAELNPANRGLGRWGYLGLLLLALLPSLGTLDAPCLAEDASIMGRALEAGALDDWTRPQYGIEKVVRFWRPMVSSSWWLQVRLFGTQLWPARLLGVLLHAGTAIVMGQLLLALGLRRAGALLGAALVACFVHQGGTLTWMAGRTDSMVGLCMLLTLWAALRGQLIAAASMAFLACACKEFAFVLPLWTALVLWAAARPRTRILRGLLAILSACTLAYLWRTLALGAWDGGYAGGGSRFGEQLLPALLNLGRSLAAQLGACLVLCGLGWWRGSLHGRLAISGLICALFGALPLVPLAASLPLEEANERLLFVASLGLAMLMAASFARLPRGGKMAWLPLVSILAWLAWSGWQAFQDTHQWARAAHLAGQHEARARALCASLDAAQEPVLVAGLPRNTDGAYCLGLGFSDRFRAPFEPAPRPIWPLRTIFEVNSRELPMLRELHAGELLLPFSGSPLLPVIPWSSAEAEPGGWLVFDERVFPGEVDLSPKIILELAESASPARLEVVVYTELGYGSIQLELPASAAGALSLSLRKLMNEAFGGHSLAEMLIHAADLGMARRAYLELRLVDAGDQVLAASAWIETRWGAEFLGSIGE